MRETPKICVIKMMTCPSPGSSRLFGGTDGGRDQGLIPGAVVRPGARSEALHIPVVPQPRLDKGLEAETSGIVLVAMPGGKTS